MSSFPKTESVESRAARDKDYPPYDDRTQILRQIQGYPRSFTRVPAAALVERSLTLSERTGPTALKRRFRLSTGDFACAVPGGPRAIGQLMNVSGRVTDEDGAPIAGALIEIWQANASGKYIHPWDRHQAPLDPNFIGQGRIATDAEGCYRFRTIKPGGYPVAESDWWWRPPHIHFSIFGVSWMDRFITQVFFPGEPLNQTDLLLNGIPDPEARQRVMFEPQPTKVTRDLNILDFHRDLVLRGKRRTPELP